MIPRAWVLTTLLLAAAPGVAHAQIFFAEHPAPPFTIGPLFLRATVEPKLGPPKIDISFSIVVPPGQSVAEQDLYLLWPGEVIAEPGLGPGDAALEKDVKDAFGELPRQAVLLFALTEVRLLAQHFDQG